MDIEQARQLAKDETTPLEKLRELANSTDSIELDCQIVSLAIEPEHIHLFINCSPDLAPKQIMHRIKGYSSYILRKEFPHLKKMPSMWTRSYFVSTAGNVSSSTIEKYIAAQGKT